MPGAAVPRGLAVRAGVGPALRAGVGPALPGPGDQGRIFDVEEALATAGGDGGGQGKRRVRPSRHAAAKIPLAAGDADARAYLERVVRDRGFGGRARAALALARRGHEAALAFVDAGLDADAPAGRARAAAVAAHLADEGGREHATAIATLAADDSDPMVRTTANVALLAF